MSMKVQLARAIASELGYDYDRVFEHKQEWIAERGMRGGRFHDVNEPYRTDFDAAADAVLDLLAKPSPEMVDAGVAMALQVSVHGEGGWSKYVGGLFGNMIHAAKEGK